MKKRVNITIGILVSALFIYLAFRRVEPAEIVYSLRHINYFWVIPNMIIVLLTMVIRSYRWKYLLQPIREYDLGKLFPPVMIGFMANNILPVRLGEVVRAYSLGAKTNESRSSIFATVVIERIFDRLALLFMFWLVFLYIPVPQSIKKFGIFTFILNVIVIIALLVLKRKRDLLIKWTFRPLFFVPAKLRERIEYIVRKFSDGLLIFGEYRALGLIVLWSLVLWLVIALSNYFIFMAFGLYPNVAASFILLFFVAAAVMLPSAPGFVGVFQAGVIGAFALMNSINIIGYEVTWNDVQTLTLVAPAFGSAPIPGIGSLCEAVGLFGISKGQALSFSIVLWLSQYLPVTLIGLYYLKREHLSLKVANS